jgi:hypothetical protein
MTAGEMIRGQERDRGQVKKYVVRLSGEERERLEALVRAGKNSAQIVTRARILLKADVSDAGDGWSDSEPLLAAIGRKQTGSSHYRAYR